MFITVEQIRTKVAGGWEDHLRGHLQNTPFAPVDISRFRKPKGNEILRHFEAVREWKDELRQGSKDVRGFGYRLEYEAVNTRTAGLQHIPARIVIDTEEDFLRLLSRKRDFACGFR